MADATDRLPPAPARPALTPPCPTGFAAGAAPRLDPAVGARHSVLAVPRAPQQLPLFPPRRG